MRQQVVGVANSSDFQVAIAKVYDGSTWKVVNPMIYDGGSWKTVGGAGTLLIPLIEKNGNAMLDSGSNEIYVMKD